MLKLEILISVQYLMFTPYPTVAGHGSMLDVNSFGFMSHCIALLGLSVLHRSLKLVSFVSLHIVVDGFLGDLFVVLFHGGEVFSGFAELALFHSLADVPVHECPLSVHEIEFVVHSAHYLCDGGGVGDHEH